MGFIFSTVATLLMLAYAILLVLRCKKMADERRLVDIAPLLKKLREEALDCNDICEPLTINEAAEAEIDDLESLPTIDPASLRPESEWELNPGRCTCEHFRCKKCHFINCVSTKYCGECGAKMKNAGVKPEELQLPITALECNKAKSGAEVQHTSGNGLEWSEV